MTHTLAKERTSLVHYVDCHLFARNTLYLHIVALYIPQVNFNVN